MENKYYYIVSSDNLDINCTYAIFEDINDVYEYIIQYYNYYKNIDSVFKFNENKIIFNSFKHGNFKCGYIRYIDKIEVIKLDMDKINLIKMLL